MRFLLSASSSAAACAAIHEKILVVIGHAKAVLCFRASAARSSLIVTTRSRGPCFINASTSRGAGMTKRPSPQRLVSLPATSPTLGSSLSSASFSRQDFFIFVVTASRQSAANIYLFSDALPRRRYND